MTNVMIDIETLGKTQNAVIASIAAVKFNINGLKEELYKVCYNYQTTRELDLPTVKWWMAQSEEAREIFTNKEIKVVSLKEALVDLKDFISRDDNVWANGVLFDIGILEHAFRSEKILFPWTYGKIRCLRGIRAIFPEYEDIMNEIRVKVSHNALDDTKCQANALIALAKLKGFTL